MTLKNFKEMLKKIVLALFIVAALSCKADPRVKLTGNLKPDAKQAIVTRELVNMLENFHYKKIAVNDSVSSVVFDQYLKLLDANRIYLLKGDIDDFEQYRLTLDDDFHDGDLSAAYHIFNVWQKRYDERMRYSLTQIDKGYDFKSNETYTYNREKLPWFASAAEANDVWNGRVKYDLLNLKIAGTDEKKNKETIKLRYENLLSQSSKVNSQDVFQRVMDALTSAVDPHTNYFNPVNAERFNEDMARTFEGIGARLQLENEMVKIVEIIPGGPAFKAKTINVNDKIIGVAQGEEGEFVDVIGWRLDNTVSKIKGPKGTKVRLKVIPAGQEMSAKPKIVELVRDKVILEEQSAKKQIKTIKSGDKTYKIGVIEIPGFYLDFKAYNAGDKNYKSTTRDVKLILDTLKQQNVDGVVIDLRANGGGSLLEAIDLTGLFIKTGPVVQVRHARNKIEINDDDDPEVAWTGPLGVMVDRFSASASEIFAGAIQDYGRGVIMGTQTYGKGTVQSSIDMSRVISPAEKVVLSARSKSSKDSSETMSRDGAPQFGQVNLTMAKFYRVNGSSTQHKGVIPDIEFPMVFPADKFGESSEPAALPWDEIKASSYKPVANLTSINKQLESLHEQRLKGSTEYKYLLEDIKEFSKREDEASVTLNEEVLKKEREEQEAKNLARDNKRRELNGLPPLKKGGPKKEEVDFIQDESLLVMADFIKLNTTNKVTQNTGY